MNIPTYSCKFRQIPTFIFEWVFLLNIFFFSVGTEALAVTLDSQTYERNLIGDIQYLEDPTGQLEIAQVLQKKEAFRNWNQSGTDLNFGFTQSTYWIRIPLQRLVDASPDWLLELDYTKYKNLQLFTPQGDVIVTGNDAPFSSRPFFDRHFVFPIQVDTKPSDYYLSVNSQYPLTIPLKVWQPNAYREKQQFFHALQFMYFGALILLAMYGFIIYLGIRDKRFLVYSAYILAIGLGNFAGNGYGRLWFWPDAPFIDEISQTNLLCLGGAFAIMFSRLILLARDDRTWLLRCMQISQQFFFVLWASTFLEATWPGVLTHISQLMIVNAIFMAGLVSLACVKGYLNRRPGTRFFIVGWLIFSVGVAAASLRSMNLIPTNAITLYAVQLSTMFEMVLMAMALADLLRLEQQAFNRTQEEALNAKQSLLLIAQESEEKLRMAVSERTQQLKVAVETEKKLREQYVRFGSIISHEFRTPLNIIQSQTSLMRKEHELGINEVSAGLNVIASATQRLKLMFDKWLHSDAMTHNLESLDTQALNLNDWLRSLVKHNSHLFFNHPVILQLHPLVKQLQADEYQLGIALTNLIDNAVKYSPPNTEIRLETRIGADEIGIAVHDQGEGIPLAEQPKVFDAFYRTNPESSVQGVGLGLSIVQRIVSAHGGRVEFISQANQGTTFCLWFPVTHSHTPV